MEIGVRSHTSLISLPAEQPLKPPFAIPSQAYIWARTRERERARESAIGLGIDISVIQLMLPELKISNFKSENWNLNF